MNYIPGDHICSKVEVAAGSGTYVKGEGIYAARWGQASRSAAPSSDPKHHKEVVQILRDNEGDVMNPIAGKEVFARVTRIFSRYVTVNVLALGEVPFPTPMNGQIRTQDMSQKNADHVIASECFRPGDIVKAKILYKSDAYGLCLSTKDDHLGVHEAESFTGKSMIRVDKNTMKCPVTGVHENRKVAMTK